MKSIIVPMLCIVLCVAAFAIRTSGQTPRTYEIIDEGGAPPVPTIHSELPNTLPALVITSDYYAQPKVLVVHLFNGSGKDITGYTIIIRHKKAAGASSASGGKEGSPSKGSKGHGGAYVMATHDSKSGNSIGFLVEAGYGPVSVGRETSGNVATYNVDSTTFLMVGGDHLGGFAGYTNSTSPIQLEHTELSAVGEAESTRTLSQATDVITEL
jgi:hypothetical protein